ncbi:MAG: DUF6745 domain-containing protein [Cyanobacteria bacterium P01_A01_bin.40]
MSLKKWLISGIKLAFENSKLISDRKKQPINRLIVELNSTANDFLDQKIASFIPHNNSPEEIVESLYQAIKIQKNQTDEKLLNLPDRSTFKAQAIISMLTTNHLPREAMSQLYDTYWIQSDQEIYAVLSQTDTAWLLSSISSFTNPSLACTASWLDFCFSTLKLSYNQRKWEAFQTMVKECGWIFVYKNTCFICDRPIKLLFDESSSLHSETEAAIQFSDGFSIWVNHGMRTTEL